MFCVVHMIVYINIRLNNVFTLYQNHFQTAIITCLYFWFDSEIVVYYGLNSVHCKLYKFLYNFNRLLGENIRKIIVLV